MNWRELMQQMTLITNPNRVSYTDISSFDWYLCAKALHIVFAVTWFAALFYVVRLFIYQTEAINKEVHVQDALRKQLQQMAYRLWYIIAWPSAVLTISFGLFILWPWLKHMWMIYKLGVIGLLFGYHLYCHKLFLNLQKDHYPLKSIQLRLLNEVPTLLLFVIVFLAVFKRTSDMVSGVLFWLLLAACLYFAIKLYRRYRTRM